MDPARIVADHLIWESIRAECAEAAANEPLLAGFLSHVVLSQPDLETALAYILAAKLDNATLPALSLRDIILDVLRDEKCIQNAIRADLQALCRGEHPGRSSDQAITVFKAVGSALEDLTAAVLVYKAG